MTRRDHPLLLIKALPLYTVPIVAGLVALAFAAAWPFGVAEVPDFPPAVSQVSLGLIGLGLIVLVFVAVRDAFFATVTRAAASEKHDA